MIVEEKRYSKYGGATVKQAFRPKEDLKKLASKVGEVFSNAELNNINEGFPKEIDNFNDVVSSDLKMMSFRIMRTTRAGPYLARWSS